MKKKLLTLVALLTTVVSGAWAQSTTDVIDQTGASGNQEIAKTSITLSGTYVAGQGGGNITGYSPSNKGVKLRVASTKVTVSDTEYGYVVLTVNSGYKVNTIKLEGTSNGDNTITLKGVYVDVNTSSLASSIAAGTNKLASDVTYPNKSTTYVSSGTLTVGAEHNMVFLFTGSDTQMRAIFTAEYEEVAGVTAAPSISFDGNNVSMTCATSGATIYYTTDGSEPTTSSTTYDGTAFTIANSCTVRAFAQKGDVASDLVKKDCYVSHASAEGFLKVLNYDGGTIDGAVWTSTADGYTLTAPTGTDLAYAGLAGSQDGFKLTANKAYTIATSPDIQITKIVVVGKTWLAGTASTIAFDGFTPASGSFFEADENRSTYVKTIEFTPSSDLDYGQTITMTPGGNQLGAYIELYGVKRSGPADPVAGETITQTVTFDEDGAVCSDATIITMTGGGIKDPTYAGYTKAMELSSNASITINLPSGSTNASVTLLGTNGATTLKLNSTDKTSVTWTGDDTNGYTLTIPIDDSNAGSTYTIAKGDGNTRIHKITLTYKSPSDTKITLTTTANMAGWRAFYDASQGYTVDNKTTVYVVSANTETNVTLTDIGSSNIPAGTPVILKTTDTDRKMTLTKATLATYTGDNELKASTAGQNLGTVYRLGYGDNGVGFYKYTTTSAAAGIVYVENVNGIDAPSLGIEIGGATAIEAATKSQHTETVVYNLNGQRVAQPTKGLYIVNGRKVVVK